MENIIHLLIIRRMSFNLKQIRKSKKVGQKALADALNVSVAQVSRLETGVSQPNLEQLNIMANTLNVSLSELLTNTPSFLPIKVVGAVEAGVLKESMNWEPERHYVINLPLPDIYKMVKPFALEVRGPSMNKRYPEGSILVCASLYNLNEELRDNKRYIIEKTVDGGDHETTVKLVKIDDNQDVWLWPESNHPEFQAPTKLNGKDGEEIRILARVLGTYQMED